MSTDTVSAAVRCVAFILLFQAAGAALFIAVCGRDLPGCGDRVRRIASVAAGAAAVAVGLHLVLEATRLSGTFAGVFDPGMQALVFGSATGASRGLQVLGLVVIAVASRGEGRGAGMVAATGAVATLGAFALVGHTQTHPWRPLLVPLLLVHLAGGAFWFGSLLPLVRVIQREAPAVAIRVLQRFSTVAVRCVPLLALAGAALLVAIARGLPELDQPYGVLIAVKVGGFTALMVLAAWNRLRLVPALAQGSKGASERLLTSLRLEAVLIAGILSVTAVLTSFYSP